MQQGFADSVEFANRVSGMYPGAGATGSAPTGLTVTTTTNTQLSLSWTTAAGTVDHYEVERQGAGGAYAWLANSTTPAFNDTAVTGSGAAYLYQVRAVFAGGATSAYSNAALGAALSFTDEPLVVGATPIKAQHLYELRQAVQAVRRLAGLGDATWTDGTLVGVVVKATHVQELRERLNEALSALGLPAGTWTDAALATGAQGTPIKAVHVAELRTQATRGSGTAQGGGGTAAVVPVDGWAALSFDAQTNRINAAGWEYDAAGNQTRALSPAGSWLRYEYDAAGRLVRVKNDANQAISTYSYGDSNQRLITEESGQRTYYVWDGDTVIAEYVEDVAVNVPQWTKSYVYLGNRLLATLTPNGGTEAVQYHHPDRLGTRLITNGADAGYSEQVTLPYGTGLDAESTGATNRRFTSYDRSSVSKLDYAVNRTYDSLQGRFTQVDPIGMGAASLDDPQTLNLYSYCGNDPINQTDPDGLFFGGLWHAIKKIFSNRWVRLAVVVALTVLTAGSTAAAFSAAFGPGSAGAIWGTAASLSLSSVLNYVLLGKLPGELAAQRAGVYFQNRSPFCTPEQGCHVAATIDVIDKLPDAAWYARFFRTLGNFATGVADDITTLPFTSWSFTQWYRHKRGWEADADENSTAYKVGGYTGEGFAIVIGALTGESELKAAGWALNRNPILRVGKGYLYKGATQKEWRIAFGGKKSFIHGHIHGGNWYNPTKWVQRFRKWKKYN